MIEAISMAGSGQAPQSLEIASSRFAGFAMTWLILYRESPKALCKVRTARRPLLFRTTHEILISEVEIISIRGGLVMAVCQPVANGATGTDRSTVWI